MFVKVTVIFVLVFNDSFVWWDDKAKASGKRWLAVALIVIICPRQLLAAILSTCLTNKKLYRNCSEHSIQVLRAAQYFKCRRSWHKGCIGFQLTTGPKSPFLWAVSKRCGFGDGEQIPALVSYGRIEGRLVEKKYAVSKISGFVWILLKPLFFSFTNRLFAILSKWSTRESG